MADVAPARGKRARSPSPVYADTLASPLEVLLKRRRRTEWANASGFASSSSKTLSGPGPSGVPSGPSDPGHNGHATSSRMFAPPPPPPPVWQTAEQQQKEHLQNHHGHAYDADNSSQAAVSSPLRRHAPEDDDDEHLNPDGSERSTFSRRAVERRRTRQWERLQDPSSTVPSSAPSGMYQHAAYSSSQAHLPMSTDGSVRSVQSPPARGYSAATPERPHLATHMSSSPIRHNPPSSTPFRDDEWTEDERLREWGDEYATQNSLLYYLHRARVEAIHTGAAAGVSAYISASSPARPANPSASASPMVTPAPQRTAPAHHPHSHSHAHAHSHLPTPYRHAQHTPLDTPGLVSSDYASSPFPFSPGPGGTVGPAPSPVHANMQPHEAETVRVGYEEANRLLAALNVARLRRFDEGQSPLGHRGGGGGATGDGDRMAMDEQW